MLFSIIVTVLVGVTVLLLANFAKKVNAETSDTPETSEPVAKVSTITEEIAIEVPTTTAKPKAKKKPANKNKKVNA
jgi:flagellar basal body-associated protein FliL